VLSGEGVATRKWDGTSVKVEGGKLFKRYDAKHGKPAPVDFVPAQDPDPVTGHWPGYVPVGNGPEDRWHREAFKGDEPDGTYELVGPKLHGNPDGFAAHTLVLHGALELVNMPCSFDAIRAYLETADIEGVVWHHPDGRMVKIKTKDFGLKRRARQTA
jgi:hypothetical protein